MLASFSFPFLAPLACFLPGRGLVEGLCLLSGLCPASGELGVPGTPSGIRELRPPVGTSADDSSQTWHRVRHYWNFTPALAANQHHSRLLAPARQLGCRRDQRRLPWRVTAGLRPRVIVRVPRPATNQLRGKLRTGVRLSAWHTAPPDIRSRSDRASGYFDMATKERYASFSRTSTAPVGYGLQARCGTHFSRFWDPLAGNAPAPIGYGLQARCAAISHPAWVITNPPFPAPRRRRLVTDYRRAACSFYKALDP